MTTSWQPSSQGLNALVQVLTNVQSNDNKKLQEALEARNQLVSHKEFAAYAAHIFKTQNVDLHMRLQAGLMVKNYLKENKDTIDARIFDVTKKSIEESVIDKSNEIRKTAANIIASIIRMNYSVYRSHLKSANQAQNVFEDWPDLISYLIETLRINMQYATDNERYYLIDGPLQVIKLLCIDCVQVFNFLKESDGLVAALLHFSNLKDCIPQSKYHALTALKHLFAVQPLCLVNKIDSYCKVLISNFDSKNESIRESIVSQMILSMNEYWKYFQSETPKVFEFMLECTNSNNNKVCLEAAEFWFLYSIVKENDIEYFNKFLPRLCPALMKRCRFTQEMIASLHLQNDNQNKPDFQTDIAPSNYHNNNKMKNDNNSYNYQDNSNDDDDDDDDDDLNDIDTNINNNNNSNDANNKHKLFNDAQWDIRRCCARQIDFLSRVEDIRPHLLKNILPIISQCWESSDVLNREAGVLALGALLSGNNYTGLESIVNELMSGLYKCINSENCLLKSISCWTVSRFSKLICEQKITNKDGISLNNDEMLGKVLQVLLQRMCDDSKRVQKAACAAIATLSDYGQFRLRSWLDPIMETFCKAFKHYKLSNFGNLMDAVTCVIRSLVIGHSNIVKTFSFNLLKLENGYQLIKQQSINQNQNQNPNNLNINDFEKQISWIKQEIIKIENQSIVTDKVIDALIPPLLNRWNTFECKQSNNNSEYISTQYNRQIFSVFEGFTTFIGLFGKHNHFQTRYLKELFVKSLNLSMLLKQETRDWFELIEETRKELINDSNNDNNNNNLLNNNNNESNIIVDYCQMTDGVILDIINKDHPNFELWTCGIDMLSILCECCQPLYEQIAFDIEFESKLLEMIWCAINQDNILCFTLRRNALALFGDLIQFCPNKMKKHCPKFLNIVIPLIIPELDTISTNASWCIGQALYAYKNEMINFFNPILTQLKLVLNDPNCQTKILCNISITMARLFKTFPNQMLNEWDKFAIDWINALSLFSQDNEKYEALNILLDAVAKNPTGLFKQKGMDVGVKCLFTIMKQWNQPDQNLSNKFILTILNFEKALSNKWKGLLQSLPAEVAQWVVQCSQQAQQQMQQIQQNQQNQQMQQNNQ